VQAINDKRNATIAELTAKLAALTAQFHSLRIDVIDGSAVTGLPNPLARRAQVN